MRILIGTLALAAIFGCTVSRDKTHINQLIRQSDYDNQRIKRVELDNVYTRMRLQMIEQEAKRDRERIEKLRTAVSDHVTASERLNNQLRKALRR